jgi:uncharacterized phiE125 gp8 family phage protein
MALVLNLAPATEPISVADLKAHLRIDSTADNAALASMITTARLQIEAALALALITQHWTWTFDRWPNRASVELPISPVQSILNFTVQRGDDLLTVPSSACILDGNGIAARLITKDGWPSPSVAANGIQIKFIAGFGPTPADVPAPLRHAVLLLAAHWYGHRDTSGTCGTIAPSPAAVEHLLAPFRRPRL